jgi:large subunit ribosomal protein L15
MQLHSVKPKTGARRARKRIGRGNASGHGTYSGRGCKGMGQRKSGNMRPGFEGGQTSLISRLPKLRGFNNPNKITYQVVNVGSLDGFNDGDEVNVLTLLEKRLIHKKTIPVKLLGNGKTIKKLTIRLHRLSKSARDKILKAGGKIL